LCRAMRGKRGQQDEPPDARWRQQKRCHQDRIRRPKDRNRIRLEGERKTDFGAKIISSEHAQPDHRQAPLKRRIETVHVPRCCLNARDFKRLGDTFHLQQISWFREAPDVTVAIPVRQQPQNACPNVAIFSHGTLHFTLHVPWGKALYSVREFCNRTVTIGSVAAVVIGLPSGRTALRYRILNRVSHVGALLFPALIESVANSCDEFFVVERLHEKGNWADGHCRGTRGKILSRRNDNYTSLG
jgi:hypothetical protein